MFGFLSNDKAFFSVFSAMAEKVHESARLLKAMVETGQSPHEYAGRIKAVEHECDRLTHDLVRKLNSTFITPLDREDIHDLMVKLDDVVDLVDSTADRMVAFSVKTTASQIHALTDVLLRQTAVLKEAVPHLPKGNRLLDRCAEIHQLENEADRLFHEGLVRLFTEVREPIELLKQKEILERMERATDKCEDVANVLEAIVLKNA